MHGIYESMEIMCLSVLEQNVLSWKSLNLTFLRNFKKTRFISKFLSFKDNFIFQRVTQKKTHFEI